MTPVAERLSDFVGSKEYKSSAVSLVMNQPTELCRIMYLAGSDKSILRGWHNYTIAYSFLFEKIRQEPINLFEVGIFQGSSLRGWRRYFPNANIYGGDIEERSMIRGEQGIETFLCDQLNPASLREMWDEKLKDVEFDIIVDDGAHEFKHNCSFLANSIHKLKPGGIFIIEDIHHEQIETFLASFDDLKEKLGISHIELVRLPFEGNSMDNNLVVIVK